MTEEALTLGRTTRLLTLAACLLGMATSAHAQRGPGGGGPGGGGPGGGGPGGGMGGPGGGMGPGGGPGGVFGPAPGAGNMGDRSQPGSMGSQHPRGVPQLALPSRWWDDRKTVKSLNLRPDQQHHMDDIFNANKATLFSLFGNLQREELRLHSLSAEDLQDQAKVFAAIDRVAQARAELEKQNVRILLEIRKELDPAQLAELDRQLARNR